MLRMEALMRTGAVSSSSPALPVGMAKDTSSLLGPRCGLGGSSIQCVRPDCRKMIVLRALDRSKLRERFESLSGPNNYRPPISRFRIRAANQSAGGNVDEKVREIASDNAVEGPNFAERDAKLKADELKSENPSTELPVAADLLLSTLKGEDEAADSALAQKGRAAASDSAVEDPSHFFQDVKEDVQQIAAELGRSVEDEVVSVENKAEELGDRQVKEAELVKKGEFDEDDETSSGTSSDESSDDSDNEIELPQTRTEAEQKLVETARDGYEVLKWAAEGVASAGQNSRQGLEVAKEAFGKRVQSFGIAADETRDVSSQAAELTKSKFQKIQGSASKFGEELQVNREEKKAADSLKPDSEGNPLTKVATAVQKNLSKASQAGQDFTSRVSERAAEISDKSKQSTEESKSGVQNDIARDYEDEPGNEFLKGEISSEGEDSTLQFDADEPQAVPSSKQDGSDIGHDE